MNITLHSGTRVVPHKSEFVPGSVRLLAVTQLKPGHWWEVTHVASGRSMTPVGFKRKREAMAAANVVYSILGTRLRFKTKAAVFRVVSVEKYLTTLESLSID